MSQHPAHLPDPPIGHEVDLTDLCSYMPLRVDQLLRSDTWLLASGDEAKAAITLWCRAWHQVPAGSLPNNDRILAKMSGIDNLSDWPTLKPFALRGFMLCSDGRLYHRRIVQKAQEAWDKIQAKSRRTEAANARWGEINAISGTHSERRSRRLADARAKGRHTDAEWQAMLEIFDHTCLSCGAQNASETPVYIVKDHIIPIYRGGSDAIENIQPLCSACNSRKQNDDIDHRDKIPDWRERLQNASLRGVKTPRNGIETPLKRSKVKRSKNPSPNGEGGVGGDSANILWQPIQAHFEIGADKGLARQEVLDEAAAYLDWNLNAKHPHKNKDAGFRNWLRDANHYRHSHPQRTFTHGVG